MQLLLIFGIAFAIAAVAFALQNNVPVTVSFMFWSFDGSLAMVLLLAIGLGAIIAGLVSSPAVIKGQWGTARLRRQVAERDGLGVTTHELDPSVEVAPEQPRPYVGLKTLLTSGGTTGSDKQA